MRDTMGDLSPPNKFTAKRQKKLPVAQRRDTASPISKFTFAYVANLVRLGNLKQLEDSDVPEVEPGDESKFLAKRLETSWQLELKKNGKNAKLWRATVKAFWFEYLLTIFWALLETGAKISEALFLGRLIDSFVDESTSGWLSALGITISVFFHGAIHHIMFFSGVRVGLRLNVGFISLLYQHLLTLNLSRVVSPGIIVNIISNDVQRFSDAAPFVLFVLIGPIETAIVLVILWNQIGVASLAGIGALLMLLPIQALFGSLFAKLRRRTVKFRDDRIRYISDVLTGIQVIKLFAWESLFSKICFKIRDEEMKVIKRASILRALNEAGFYVSPSIISLFTFMTLYFMGTTFTPREVFVSLTLFNVVRLTMTNFFPKAIQFSSESMVSFRRIQEVLSWGAEEAEEEMEKFTMANEVPEPPIHSGDGKAILAPELNEAPLIELKNVSLNWADKNILRDISLNIHKGELVGVVGPVGSGKTSFLNGLLGEMKQSGTLLFDRKTIGYFTQSPWILAGTVRDNILFGKPYDHEKFQRVIRACALDKDLERLSDGDLTYIGERGVSLSGGQKARVGLARCVYSDADVLILDDPLSAVDSVVGRALFENCIRGVLKGKTIVLATHQLQYLKDCDRLIVFEHGRVAASGSYKDVLKKDNGFINVLKEFDGVSKAETSGSAETDVAEELVREVSTEKAEDMVLGTVSWKVYIDYFRAGGGVFLIILLGLFLVAGEASLVLTNWWLAVWSASPAQQDTVYPAVFTGLVMATVTIAITRAIMFFLLALHSNTVIFRKMLQSVLRCPMLFFQNQPLGRLLNRFSKDLTLCDEMLILTFYDFLQCIFMIVGTLVITAAIIPFTLIAIPPILVVFYILRRYYLVTSRQIKRLESTTRSPVYSMISSTLEGLSVIRAFGAQERFAAEFIEKQNNNTKHLFQFLQISRWLGFRLDMLAASFLAVTAFVAVALKDSLNPAYVGLILAYTLQLIGLLQWSVRQSAEVENYIISVERMMEYTQLEPESPEVIEGYRPPDGWPFRGEIIIKNLTLTYPNGDKPVLDGITVRFEPGQKIGICGRTGSGKSTTLNALFRMFEADWTKSDVIIDGMSIQKMGLKDLRSRLSIIPQEPFLFRGSLRFNIDPFGACTDQEIWHVLDAVELTEKLLNDPLKLETMMTDGGANWSHGERQLIVLARALLRKSKIVCMDEATANIDLRTDRLIQKAIRGDGKGKTTGLFQDATVLIIAHRLDTIVNCDKILVLEDGVLQEFDEPIKLLNDPESKFFNLVSHTGPAATAKLKEMASMASKDRNERKRTA